MKNASGNTQNTPLVSGKTEWETGLMCTVDAADFVAHVCAVVPVVALVAAVDARTIAAFKLIRATRGMSYRKRETTVEGFFFLFTSVLCFLRFFQTMSLIVICWCA